MRLVIEKSRRRLTVLEDESPLRVFPIALGREPVGPKERAGDRKTPEVEYFVCLKKIGKFGFALGLSYPNLSDAQRMGAEPELVSCIRERAARGERPPWGTFLGGEIFLHGGGIAEDWTAGCVALRDEDARWLYEQVPLLTSVIILP